MKLLDIEKKMFEEFVNTNGFRTREKWATLCDALLEIGSGNRELTVNNKRVPPVLISRMNDMLNIPTLRVKFGNLQFRQKEYGKMLRLPPNSTRTRNKLQWSLVSAIAEVTEEFFFQLDKLMES